MTIKELKEAIKDLPDDMAVEQVYADYEYLGSFEVYGRLDYDGKTFLISNR